MTTSNLVRAGFTYVILHVTVHLGGKPWQELKSEKNLEAGTEAETSGVPACTQDLFSLYNPDPPAQGWYHLQCGWSYHINQ